MKRQYVIWSMFSQLSAMIVLALSCLSPGTSSAQPAEDDTGWRFVIPPGVEDRIDALFLPYSTGQSMGPGVLNSITVDRSQISVVVTNSNGTPASFLVGHPLSAGSGDHVFSSVSLSFPSVRSDRVEEAIAQIAIETIRKNDDGSFPWIKVFFKKEVASKYTPPPPPLARNAAPRLRRTAPPPEVGDKKKAPSHQTATGKTDQKRPTTAKGTERNETNPKDVDAIKSPQKEEAHKEPLDDTDQMWVSPDPFQNWKTYFQLMLWLTLGFIVVISPPSFLRNSAQKYGRPFGLLALVCFGLAGLLTRLIPNAVFEEIYAFEHMWLLWLLLPALSIYALHRILREKVLEYRMVALLAIPAYLVRASYEHLPANWYLDISGPINAVEEAYMRRGGGFANIFRGLSNIVDLPGSAIFFTSVLCSTLAVVFLSSAFRNTENIKPWPPWTHLIWGLLLAFDPILVEIGASDAPHNISLLAFSLTLWCYREILEAKPGPTATRLLLLLPMVACLPGLTRPGLTTTVVFVPILFFASSLKAPLRNKAMLGVAVGAAVAAGSWFGRDLGAAIRPLEIEQSLKWLSFQTKPLMGIFGVHGPTHNLDSQHALFAICVGIFVFVGFRKRSLPALITLLSYYLIAAPKLLSDFAGDPIGQDLTVSRYVMVQITVLLLIVAAGASWGLHFIQKHSPRRIFLAVSVLLIWPWIGKGFSSGALYAPQALAYRVEYDFLREQIAELPLNSTIYQEWAERFPSGIKDPDTGLAPRYAPLLFMRPDIRYVILSADEQAPKACSNCFYYHSASCSLDLEHIREMAPPEDGIFVQNLLTRCAEHKTQVESWVAQEERRATTLFWRVRDNKVRLGLGRLPDEGTAPP